MTVLYSSDAEARNFCRKRWLAEGIECIAPPPAAVLPLLPLPETSVLVFIGRPDYALAEYARRQTVFFCVGDDPGGIAHCFPSADSPELIHALLAADGDCRRFSYGNLLYADAEETLLLGYPLELTPDERAILSYLVRHREREINVRELRLYCLGSDTLSRSNVIQHISSINKKAAEICGRKMIAFVSPVNGGTYRLRENF